MVISRFAILIFSAVLILPNLVWAQARPSGFTKPLPAFQFVPDDLFNRKTLLKKNEKSSDKALSYKIRIPKDWGHHEGREGEIILSKNIFQELDEFYGPPRTDSHRSTVSIKALELDFKLTAEQWALKYFLSLGYNIEGMNVYSDERAEVIVIYVDRGESYVKRAVVEINNKRVIMAEYILPVDYWEEEKIIQAQMLNSFQVLNRDESAPEELKVYGFLDVVDLKYPASWRLKAAPLTSVDRMSAQLLNMPQIGVVDENEDRPDGIIDGRIQMNVISVYGTESLDVEIKTQQEPFKELNFDFSEENETETGMDFYFDDAFEYAKVTAYNSAAKGKRRTLEYEVWFAMMGAGDYFYFVKLLTPSRNADYYKWLQNTQVFKSVLEGLEPDLRSTAL